jgi:hypothetical protein
MHLLIGPWLWLGPRRPCTDDRICVALSTDDCKVLHTKAADPRDSASLYTVDLFRTCTADMRISGLPACNKVNTASRLLKENQMSRHDGLGTTRFSRNSLETSSSCQSIHCCVSGFRLAEARLPPPAVTWYPP